MLMSHFVKAHDASGGGRTKKTIRGMRDGGKEVRKTRTWFEGNTLQGKSKN